jgi:chemotaxis protein methyltransferase CheR
VTDLTPEANAGPVIPLEMPVFRQLRVLIRELTGIHLSDAKHALVASRLQRRLRTLGLRSFSSYLALVRDDASGAEKREIVNAITTNKTSFFREPHHFEFLMKTIVPEIAARAEAGGPKRIRVWSAACSSGQEPWSIAIALQHALGVFSDWDIRILASDLDTEMLRLAEEATYSAEAIAGVPVAYRKAAFVEVDSDRYCVVPELKRLVTFRRINLIERPWPIRVQFDAVFCRNVAIYFDRETQKPLFEGLARTIAPTGYFFSGHSENLHWLSDTFSTVGNTIHALTGSKGARVSRAPRPRLSVSRQSVRVPALPAPRQVSIRAGEIGAAAERTIIHTLLGSCVASCLYDPELRIGGMNHFMLPDGDSEARIPACFGIHAMELVINKMMRLGAARERLVAKLFGASELRDHSTIARNNADFAVSFLEAEGIPIVARKLGSKLPLSIFFDTYTGGVRVKSVGQAKQVEREEVAHLARISKGETRIAEDMTIFGEGAA